MNTTSPLSRLQELLPQLFEATQLPGDRYLRFQLTADISGLFSMEYVQESLLVSSEQITPIPNMSGAVIGLMNSRDRVFCVIDLAQLLGMSPLSAYARQYHLVVVRVSELVAQPSSPEKELLLGIAVSRVQGISRVISEEIHALNANMPGNFPVNLKPYLRGWVMERENQQLVLDLKTIVEQSLKTADDGI